MGFTLVTTVGVNTRDGRTLAELTQGFLRGVVASNRVAIREAKRRGKPLPKLYESAVQYEPEPWPSGVEEFADIVTVLKRGWGDCDDLCAARVAELLEEGEPADCRVYWRRRCACGGYDGGSNRCDHCGRDVTGQPLRMHCEVRRGICFRCLVRLQLSGAGHVCPRCKQPNTGKIEDPSRFLGL